MDGLDKTDRVDRAALSRRWYREGIADQVAQFRDEVRAECRAQGMTRAEAQAEAWRRAIDTYPPLEVINDIDVVYSPDQGVSGLSDLPPDWNLPPSASLQSEIQWVQSNRLLVTVGDGVDLARAQCPPPSMSALSWLECSLRAYSKFIDVAARVTASAEGEEAVMKRERASIEEVRSLLAEMVEPGSPGS